jgi:hypothetical protein
MLTAWVAWLELWAARAVDADPILLDREHLIEGVYRKRNGDAKLAERIAHRAGCRCGRRWNRNPLQMRQKSKIRKLRNDAPVDL